MTAHDPDRAAENHPLFLMCIYRAEQALCHPDRARSPGNNYSPDRATRTAAAIDVVVIDRNIADMEEEVRRLRVLAASPETLLPEVVRSTQLAEHMEEMIARFREMRIELTGDGDDSR